ncbi:hypothetical protein BC777_0586 [Yoonia maricola]|uniref:Uncharacterized protein n=1 Tax=Yoonia maricola TaxID=420999 RepID=A0A2M8WLF7_9RHOB|nr:hypothetical protein BC777_0586 [Yoonia maricola]
MGLANDDDQQVIISFFTLGASEKPSEPIRNSPKMRLIIRLIMFTGTVL